MYVLNKFVGFTVFFLLTNPAPCFADQTYTDYDGAIRIQNHGISADYFNPVGLAKKIKAVTRADWVAITRLRESNNLFKRFAHGRYVVPMYLDFVIKKNGNFSSFVCSVGYYKQLESLMIEKSNCTWRNQLSSTSNPYDPSKDFEGFTYPVTSPDSTFVFLDCEYRQLVGLTNGKIVSLNSQNATQGEYLRKHIYFDVDSNLQMELGRFRLDYVAATQKITLTETDPTNKNLAIQPHFETARLQNRVLHDPELRGQNLLDSEIPFQIKQTKVLAISRGPLIKSDGNSLGYEIHGSCSIKN